MINLNFNNVKIKAIVLFLAILIWFFVKTEDNYRFSFGIPIRISNLLTNRIIESPLPKEIKITCWGKGRDLLSSMLRNDIFYNLDIGKVQPSAKFVLQVNQIKVPHKRDIEVLNIVAPETITVSITELVSKRIPITPQISIETAPGYTVIDEITTLPESVDVIGPESEIKKILTVHTEARSFTNIKRDLQKNVPIVNPSKHRVRLALTEVKVFADVQKLMEKPLSEIPVEVINKPPELKVTVYPSTLSLILEGGADLLLEVTKNDIQAYIDYAKVRTSTAKNHPAYIVTPKDIRYRDVKPKRFKIVVEKVRK